ncbi:MAG: ChbG/HpnK family deacetylase [Deltaproteobacteria bacterium]|nr:ChbG/HpnK family deacetylase [Deltaproteobacteria bacterium]
MLIINADDWGMDTATTDRILSCFKNGKITSTTAMMFMEDSERSSELARLNNLPIGLHLNFTKPFTTKYITSRLKDYHNTLVAYFTKSKYARIIYNPKIQCQVEYCFKAQLAEFERLYGKFPTHIDGHHHIHLCSNLIFSKIIPSGMKIRKNFSFSKKEKNFINRAYRASIDLIIKHRFLSTDFFYSLNSHVNESDILKKLNRARDSYVELMVHPVMPEEYNFIMSARYARIIHSVVKGSYETL